MSWRAAAAFLRSKAAEARKMADELPIPEARIAVFDKPALRAWLNRRLAQDRDALANECQQFSYAEDPTVIERKRG